MKYLLVMILACGRMQYDSRGIKDIKNLYLEEFNVEVQNASGGNFKKIKPDIYLSSIKEQFQQKKIKLHAPVKIKQDKTLGGGEKYSWSRKQKKLKGEAVLILNVEILISHSGKRKMAKITNCEIRKDHKVLFKVENITSNIQTDSTNPQIAFLEVVQTMLAKMDAQ